jgi:hypothetical protein
MDIPCALEVWQQSGGQRLFKLIVSPAAASKLDLQKTTPKILVSFMWVSLPQYKQFILFSGSSCVGQAGCLHLMRVTLHLTL